MFALNGVLKKLKIGFFLSCSVVFSLLLLWPNMRFSGYFEHINTFSIQSIFIILLVQILFCKIIRGIILCATDDMIIAKVMIDQ